MNNLHQSKKKQLNWRLKDVTFLVKRKQGLVKQRHLVPDGRAQILHVDRMCNECGNCLVFCPYDSAPYRDKFTLFYDRAGFDESGENQGFLPLGGSRVLVRLNGQVEEIDLDETNGLPADIDILIYTVLTRYRYLLG